MPTVRPALTIAVDLGRKATKQTNKQTKQTNNVLVEKKDQRSSIWIIKL